MDLSQSSRDNCVRMQNGSVAIFWVLPPPGAMRGPQSPLACLFTNFLRKGFPRNESERI